jgi:hypothetical protein
MTVEKLKKLENVIKPILENQPQTREDDFLLYAEVIKEYYPDLLNITTGTFLVSHKFLNVPNIKSVERARRKIQEKHPELATERAKRKRATEQEAYMQYGRG